MIIENQLNRGAGRKARGFRAYSNLKLATEERVVKHPSDGTEGQTMVSQDSVSKDFRQQLEGYGLTTANILYRRPDHPWLLQTYVWQGYDLCPIFPKLNKFLNFWLEKL